MASVKSKDYMAIARKKVTRPADSTGLEGRKILVYGRNKKGKSTFSLSGGIENTLILDPEKGTDMMRKSNPYRWPITSWKDTQEFWGAARTGELSPFSLGMGKEKKPFSIYAVDGTTKLHTYAMNFVRKQAEDKDIDRQPGLTTQRDYGRAGELLKQLMTNFDSLPYTVVYSAQERMFTPKGGEEDGEEDDASSLRVPDLPQGVRGYLNSLVDVIGRIYVVKVKVKRGGKIVEVNQRRLWIGTHSSYDTGFRSEFELPDMVKQPTIPKLLQLMIAGEEN